MIMDLYGIQLMTSRFGLFCFAFDTRTFMGVPERPIGGRLGLLAQFFLEYHERQSSLRDQPLEGVERACPTVEDQPLPKQAVEENRYRHERRRKPEPTTQSGFPKSQSFKLALHVAALRVQPELGRLPIVMHDPRIERFNGALHSPGLGVPLFPNGETTHAQ